MAAFYEQLAQDRAPAHALAAAQAAIRRLSGEQIAARYTALGGSVDPGAVTVRRGVTRERGSRTAIPFDPAYSDTENPDEPLESLTGNLPPIWAPFVLIGS